MGQVNEIRGSISLNDFVGKWDSTVRCARNRGSKFQTWRLIRDKVELKRISVIAINLIRTLWIDLDGQKIDRGLWREEETEGRVFRADTSDSLSTPIVSRERSIYERGGSSSFRKVLTREVSSGKALKAPGPPETRFQVTRV